MKGLAEGIRDALILSARTLRETSIGVNSKKRGVRYSSDISIISISLFADIFLDSRSRFLAFREPSCAKLVGNVRSVYRWR